MSELIYNLFEKTVSKICSVNRYYYTSGTNKIVNNTCNEISLISNEIKSLFYYISKNDPYTITSGNLYDL